VEYRCKFIFVHVWIRELVVKREVRKCIGLVMLFLGFWVFAIYGCVSIYSFVNKDSLLVSSVITGVGAVVCVGGYRILAKP